MISLLAGLWDNFVNSIRELDPTTRYIIMGILLFCFVACIAFVINKGDKHYDEPIRWRYLIFAALFLGAFFILVLFNNGG